jgi:hypothetical protein
MNRIGALLILALTMVVVDNRGNGTDQLTSRLTQRYVAPLDDIGLIDGIRANPPAVAAMAKGIAR